jgi:hypothetical protein
MAAVLSFPFNGGPFNLLTANVTPDAGSLPAAHWRPSC